MPSPLEMNEGGFFRMINKTPHDWVLVHIHSYQMGGWNFPKVIRSGGEAKVYIEFQLHSTNLLKLFFASNDDGGEAKYSIQGTDLHFQVEARHPGNCKMQVNWMNVADSPLFFSAPCKSRVSDLGWKHNGDCSLTVVSPAMSAPSIERSVSLHKGWMENAAPMIGHLSLDQLCLVESHDSGTYRMDYAFHEFVGLWSSTQNLNIQGQLEAGVRVLDLRVGCVKDNKWILVHDTWLTTCSIESALDQVLSYVDSNVNEVVILDLHRFMDSTNTDKKLKGTFDFRKLQSYIVEKLGSKLFKRTTKLPTLNEIWATEGRIIVAWCDDSIKEPFRIPRNGDFFDGVNQGWYEDADSEKTLHAAIEQSIAGGRKTGQLSTEGAILPPSVFPIHPLPCLGKWFKPDEPWASTVNIVQCDFVEEIGIISNCIQQCLINGTKFS